MTGNWCLNEDDTSGSRQIRLGPFSECEGHKEHDICACDEGLVSKSLPPVIAVTGWTLSDTVKTHMLNAVLSILLSATLKEWTNQFNTVRYEQGVELK